jgi:hypothetical protein
VEKPQLSRASGMPCWGWCTVTLSADHGFWYETSSPPSGPWHGRGRHSTQPPLDLRRPRSLLESAASAAQPSVHCLLAYTRPAPTSM